MRLVTFYVAACVCATFFAAAANASSTRPLPLKRMEYLSEVQIRRIDTPKARSSNVEDDSAKVQRRSQNHILHSDSIRLSFRAFSNDFYLHLQPTQDLVPEEGATVRYTAYDPTSGTDVVQRTETLFPRDVRAFQGVVMHSRYTSRRISEDLVGLRRDLDNSFAESDEGLMGKASILLHDDGAESGQIRFEGMFDWDGNEHVIQSPLNYHTTRSEHDPPLAKRDLQTDRVIVHRSSDRMTRDEAAQLGLRSLISDDEEAGLESGCSADRNDYNMQHALRLPDEDLHDELRSLSPMSFFASFQQPKLGRRHLSMLPDLLSSSAGAMSGMHLFRRSDGGHATQHRQRRRALELMDSHAPYSYHESFVKRQGDLLGGTNNNSYIDDIGSTQGCPSSNRVVYIGMAADCTYTGRFNNESDARLAVLNSMNTVSNIYRSTFRVALGVVELDIRSSNNCPTVSQGNAAWNRQCDDSYALDQRLSDFSAWRADQPANGTGLWHLLTTCLSGSEVGVAWLGTLCKTDRSGTAGNIVSGTGVTASTQNEAQTIAHEIGHNFGAVHDCVTGCSIGGSLARQSAQTGGSAICCPRTSSSCNSNGDYIMSPVSTGRQAQEFSPCSIGNICSMLRQGLDTECVEDPSQSQRATLSAQQCGNGILEPGEECDAGPNGSQCCTNQCRLTSGSVCDPDGSACCTNQCQFANATTVCRPAIDDRCDTAETCTGTSAECPEDIRRDNGDSCGDDLQCAAGHCTSRDLQCQQQSSDDYNFQEACPLTADNSCSVSCLDPRQPNSCAILQQNFIDGTECGYGGFCEGGECKSGSWQSTFRAWYRENLRISIPVTIVVGIVVLLVLWGLIRCLCLPLIARKQGHKAPMGIAAVAPAMRNRSRRGRGSNVRQSQYASYAPQSQPPPQHPNSYRAYDPTNMPQYPTQTRHSQGWTDPYAYNGPTGSSYPTHQQSANI